MHNNQSTNDVYQTPSSQNGESFGDRIEMSEAEVSQKFADISREAVRQAFDKITQDLEMSISGYEMREVPTVEVSPTHPIAIELLDVGKGVKEHRKKQQAMHAERMLPKSVFGRYVMKRPLVKSLFMNTSGDAAQPLAVKSLDHESALGVKPFPVDKDVYDSMFFLHESEDSETKEMIDVWHYDQKSVVHAKNFTISYKVTESRILKNATFYDERLAKIVNRSSIPTDVESRNLLVASKKYYAAITEKPYIKSAAPRFRFGSKSDRDLAA